MHARHINQLSRSIERRWAQRQSTRSLGSVSCLSFRDLIWLHEERSGQTVHGSSRERSNVADEEGSTECRCADDASELECGRVVSGGVVADLTESKDMVQSKQSPPLGGFLARVRNCPDRGGVSVFPREGRTIDAYSAVQHQQVKYASQGPGKDSPGSSRCGVDKVRVSCRSTVVQNDSGVYPSWTTDFLMPLPHFRTLTLLLLSTYRGHSDIVPGHFQEQSSQSGNGRCRSQNVACMCSHSRDRGDQQLLETGPRVLHLSVACPNSIRLHIARRISVRVSSNMLLAIDETWLSWAVIMDPWTRSHPRCPFHLDWARSSTCHP
nr:hypothetical protein CFP56_04542 [Quercus suber]